MVLCTITLKIIHASAINSIIASLDNLINGTIGAKTFEKALKGINLPPQSEGHMFLRLSSILFRINERLDNDDICMQNGGQV